MEIGVLGPLIMRSASINRAPSASKQRSVLATLLVHADQVVPASSLMHEIWEDGPPPSSLTTLQTYIMSLRKLLTRVTGLSAADVSRKVLITRAGGYLFKSSAGKLDTHRYNSLVASGRQALSVGDDRVGIRDLNTALQLWRGPALVDVATGRMLESKRAQLEESRLAALANMIDAEIRLGMYRDVLAELAELTIQNPLHEGLHTQYMRALCCSGRRGQALEVFGQLRGNLIAELGLDPGPSAQRLHQVILNSRDDLEESLRRAPRLNDLPTSSWTSARSN
jgi:SARP family transcriptional regulator, regulator of embCAB operon